MECDPNRRLLIVDDKEENLAAAKEVFPEAVLARSAKEALALLKSEPANFDQVITDLEMESPAAGAWVIAETMASMRECIVVTGGGQNHGSETVAILPADITLSRIYDPGVNPGKAGPDPWAVTKCLLENRAIDPVLKEGSEYYKHHPERLESDRSGLVAAVRGYQNIVSSHRKWRPRYRDLAHRPKVGEEMAGTAIVVWLGSHITTAEGRIKADLRRILGEIEKPKDPGSQTQKAQGQEIG